MKTIKYFIAIILASFLSESLLITNILPVIKQSISDAHLNHPNSKINSYIKDIKEHYTTLQSQHINTFYAKMIPQERNLKDSHYVFYHGQSNDNRIIVDVLKKIHQQVCPDKNHQCLEYFRSESDLKKYDVNTDTALKIFHDLCFDHGDLSEPCRTIMLPVNLSFFGNANTDYDSNSLEYALFNKNQKHETCNGLLNAIRCYNISLNNEAILKKYYIAMLTILNQSNAGCLYQIFIPHDYVDTCVYLSWALGYPVYYGKKMSSSDSDDLPAQDFVLNKMLFDNTINVLDREVTQLKTYPKISDIIPLYCNDSEKYSWDLLNTLQARIILPALYKVPNIQIYQYDLLSEEANKQYQDELNKFTNELFKESLANNKILGKKPIIANA